MRKNNNIWASLALGSYLLSNLADSWIIIKHTCLEFNQPGEIRSTIKQYNTFLVTTHTNPDGDAIGSSLALYHFLHELGKDVRLIVPNLYPDFLAWMPGNENILVYERDGEKVKQAMEGVEAVFCLDYNAISRSGSMKAVLAEIDAVKVLIDHHPQPEVADFDILHSITETSSTSELLYGCMKACDPEYMVSPEVATCLYVGIMTDTGSFSFACDRPETFSVTAELLATGISSEWIHRKVYDTFSEDRLRLLGFSLSEKLMVMPEFATAYISLSAKELKRFNYKVGDTEGIVNYALSIKGISLAVLLTERKAHIRLSFRSRGNFNVNVLAREYFGGGGHRNAAGGDSYESLDSTIKKLHAILPAYREQLLEEADK